MGLLVFLQSSPSSQKKIIDTFALSAFSTF